MSFEIRGGDGGDDVARTGEHVPEFLGVNVGTFVNIVGLQVDSLARPARAGLHALRETHWGGVARRGRMAITCLTHKICRISRLNENCVLCAILLR
jgi:hypothetical protein